MKLKLFNITLSVLALSAVIVMSSCSDDDPSAKEKNLNLLTSHGWTLKRVTVDGVDKTSVYEGLTISWNENNTFTTTQGGLMWPATGTWSFTDESAQALSVALINVDDATVTLETLNETSLIISFHWDDTTIGQGRTKSVEGEHVFEFEPVN